MKQEVNSWQSRADRRHLLLLVFTAGSLALMMSLQPFGQNPKYHDFADRRAFFDIPNTFDVVSNLAFLVVGLAGLWVCLRRGASRAYYAWIIMFSGICLVSAGSAFYHLNPSNEALVWDRLPMTIGFAGLLVALLGEYVSTPLGEFLLTPVLLLGLFSVIYWHWSDDLRLYYWVQSVCLLTIPVIMLLYRPKYSHQSLLLAALGCYTVAKVLEIYDSGIFLLSGGTVSGHTLKHVLSALGCAFILVMLQRRKLLKSQDFFAVDD